MLSVLFWAALAFLIVTFLGKALTGFTPTLEERSPERLGDAYELGRYDQEWDDYP